jgi:hypothetical protein
MYQFHFLLSLAENFRSVKKTMDKSDRRLPSTYSLFRSLTQRARGPVPHPHSPPCVISCIWCCWECCHYPTNQWGEVRQLTHLSGGATRTRQSSAATASAASSEVAPIPAPSRKSAPEGIPGNVSIAATRASIRIFPNVLCHQNYVRCPSHRGGGRLSTYPRPASLELDDPPPPLWTFLLVSPPRSPSSLPLHEIPPLNQPTTGVLQ